MLAHCLSVRTWDVISCYRNGVGRVNCEEGLKNLLLEASRETQTMLSVYCNHLWHPIQSIFVNLPILLRLFVWKNYSSCSWRKTRQKSILFIWSTRWSFEPASKTRTLILAVDRDYISGTWRRVSFDVAEGFTAYVFKVGGSSKHVRNYGDCVLVDTGSCLRIFLYLR